MLLKNIISDIYKTFSIEKSSFWKIKKSGPKTPKKSKNRPKIYTYCDSDYQIIDEIIINLNKDHYCAFIYDVFKYTVSNPNCDVSFKKCKLNTFYKIMR